MYLKKIPAWLQNSAIFSGTLLMSIITLTSVVLVSGPMMYTGYVL